MTRLAVTTAALVALTCALAAQRGTPAKPLDIYVVDTEGGKAALWVTPAGQSVLIDSGNPGNRDHDRLMAAINDAGVKQIDFLISTHYHVDHIGGLQELAKQIPIAHFIDHGPSVEPREQVQGFQAAYEELYGKAKHTIVKPGDKIPVTGLDWRIVTSAGNVLKTPLPGAGKPNPACEGLQPKDMSPTDDNGQSVGSVITFGQFRAIDLGDLLWNKENELMCPNNPVGTVDVFFVTHHGLDLSNSPALVHAVQPRVAIMQNGTRKGGGVEATKTMRTSPGFEDLWQLHWSYNAGLELNSPALFIANIEDPATIAGVLTAPPRGGGPGGAGRGAPGGAPAGGPPGAGGPPAAGAQPPATDAATPAGGAGAPAPGAGAPAAAGAPGAGGPGGGGGGRGAGAAAAAHTPAYWIKLSVQPDGSFTVTNSRNGFSKTYAKRR
jgi:competence protein ComEC